MRKAGRCSPFPFLWSQGLAASLFFPPPFRLCRQIPSFPAIKRAYAQFPGVSAVSALFQSF